MCVKCNARGCTTHAQDDDDDDDDDNDDDDGDDDDDACTCWTLFLKG